MSTYNDLSQAIWDNRETEVGDNLAATGAWLTTEYDGGGLADIYHLDRPWDSDPDFVAALKSADFERICNHPFLEFQELIYTSDDGTDPDTDGEDWIAGTIGELNR